MKLNDRVALVTGAAHGIGRATALALAKEGARIAIADLDRKGADQVARDIQGQGGQALAVAVDVTSSAQVREAVARVLTIWGRIDILVNNAGINAPGLFVDSDEATWDKLLDIDLKGPIILCHAVLPGMMERGYGKIVNISSGAGRLGATRDVVYSAAKAGVIGLTKALAREAARYKINVNCICPGPVDTPLFGKSAAEAPRMAEAMVRSIPWRRIGRPEEIAAAVLFLASDDAEYITGQTLSVDGGLTMI